MIRYKESVLLLLGALLITSCTQNELPVNGKEAAPLTFNLSLSGNDRSEIRAVASPFYEWMTIPVYLYLYKVGDTTPLVFLEGQINNGENVTITYWPDNEQMRQDSYDIYAVGYDGNSSGIASLDKNTTKTDLLNLIQSSVDINAIGKMYMLSGELKNTNFNNSYKTITLQRNVCRLSLNIADNTPGKVLKKITVSFESLNKTYVFNSEARNSTDIPVDAANEEYTKEILPVDHVFNDSIYFFEKKPVAAGMQETDKVLVTITALRPDPVDAMKDDVIRYQFYLNEDEGFITRRNTIYRVRAALNLTEITFTLNNPIHWDAEIVDDTQVIRPD